MWSDTTFTVYKTDKTKGIGNDGRTYLLAYDTHRVRDATICNASEQDGVVCRLAREHDGPHLRFTGELVATTGIHVVAVLDG